jgi:hypothetical protein
MDSQSGILFVAADSTRERSVSAPARAHHFAPENAERRVVYLARVLEIEDEFQIWEPHFTRESYGPVNQAKVVSLVPIRGPGIQGLKVLAG